MAICGSDRESSKDYTEEDCSSNYGSELDFDSGTDPSYSVEEETCSKFKNLSIKKKSKSGVAKDSDITIKKDAEETETDFPEVDGKSYEHVQKIIKDGKLEKLKVYECKVYLRKNGLRLSGNKDILIQRIKEHLEISNGGGEKKYPLSSFVMNCKGDACTGDIVMFEQTVYDMFNIASRSACGTPCGTRFVAGRIVKESYGAAKQQHTFTIEVLWSNGEKPLPPLHPLLIKGRNLYRFKTLRQRWEDEGERQKVLMEKHSRGSFARSDREVRVQEKERRKVLRENRLFKKVEGNKNQSQLNSTRKMEIQLQQPGSSANSGIIAAQNQSSSVAEPQQLAIQSQQSILSVAPREKLIQLPERSVFDPNYRTRIFQSEHETAHASYSNQNQISHDLVVSEGVRGVRHRNGDINYKQPNFHKKGYWNGINEKSMMTGKNEFSETNYHRRHSRSMNHCHPATLPQRQGFHSQQLCRYYAQGRCYYGENCNLLHEGEEKRSWR